MLHLLETKPHNKHYLSRYFKFILSRTTVHQKYLTHRHHILPKAKDFFPEFKNFKENSWNLIYLTHREHFIAHLLLHKAFKGSSQSVAFFNMSNILNQTNSKVYAECKAIHKSKIIEITKDPIRNAKISKALTGKLKSEQHKQNLRIPCSDAKRIKLKIANTGKIRTQESKDKQSKSLTGKSKQPLSQKAKRNISESKMSFMIVTPFGEFNTFGQCSESCDIPIKILKNIFRALHKIPKEKSLKKINLTNPDKLSWRDLGFYKSNK